MTSPVTSAPRAAPDPRRWRALALLCLAFFMVILDSAIVLVAMPSIDADLGLGASNLQWVLSAYMLSFGGLLLFGGRMADLLGRRRMFMLGTALFALASLVCGLASSDAVLLAARVAQGVASALMTPAAMAILMTTFAEGSERNKAIGVWTATGATAATAAWIVGGPITSGLGWEWIFLINVPVALGVFALSPVLLRESRESVRRRTFDVGGALTSTGALVLLVYAVVEAPEVGWGDGRTLALFAIAAVLLGLFVAIESRSAAPLVPLRLFRSPTLVGGNVVMIVNGMLVYGMSLTLTLYAQDVLAYTPTEFGLGSAIMAAGSAFAASTFGPRLVTRYGFRVVAVGGLTLMGAGCALLSGVSTDGTYLGDLFFGLLIFGPGIGTAHLAGTVATLAGVNQSDSGVASGLSNASFQIGAALGVAILTTVSLSHAEGSDPLVALTEGSQAAFVGAVVFAGVGLVAALALLRTRNPSGVVPGELAVAASKSGSL